MLVSINASTSEPRCLPCETFAAMRAEPESTNSTKRHGWVQAAAISACSNGSAGGCGARGVEAKSGRDGGTLDGAAVSCGFMASWNEVSPDMRPRAAPWVRLGAKRRVAVAIGRPRRASRGSAHDANAQDLVADFDRVEHVEAFAQLAEDRVAPVEVRRRAVRDEELAAAGFEVLVARHAERTAHVFARRDFVAQRVRVAAPR